MAGTFDVAIIGGGINGCGIARDAAGRGLSVFLCEQADLASGTSSASTKLIHGGLRYLEYYEFRLVREALQEREVLLARRRRTSSGRCASCCRITRACGRPGCCGSASSSMTISAAASSCRRRAALDLAQRSGRQAAEARRFRQGLRIFRLLGRRCAAGRAERDATPRDRGADIRTRTRAVAARTAGRSLAPAPSSMSRAASARRSRRARWSTPPARGSRARLSDVAQARRPRRASAWCKGCHIVVPQAVRPRPLLHLPEHRRADRASPFPTSRTSR